MDTTGHVCVCVCVAGWGHACCPKPHSHTSAAYVCTHVCSHGVEEECTSLTEMSVAWGAEGKQELGIGLVVPQLLQRRARISHNCRAALYSTCKASR